MGGGDDDEQWVTPATWALDVERNTWRRLADLNVARHGHAAAAVGPDVFVFGGPRARATDTPTSSSALPFARTS